MQKTGGMFISFEGSEGAGKSTQIRLLEECLRLQGRQVQLVREPGGTLLGEEIRQILKHATYGEVLGSEAELLLFAASRAQLVREVIYPALHQGRVVLSDRFTDSSVVYQGWGRALPIPFIDELNRFATQGVRPDLTVLLDLPAAEGLERARLRGEKEDRMESMENAFYERVRAGYLSLASAEPERFLVLDARLPQMVIAEKIQEEIRRREGATHA